MRAYFQSYEKYFWQWEDDGAVVSIPGANTVAYKDYLGDVLEKLSPQGLPPFGSLLLAIIATNPDGATSLDVVYRITSDALKTTDDNDLARAINFLKLLAELPGTFKEGPKRIQVLQVLFERCHNILSIRNSEEVVRKYRNGLNADSVLTFNRSVVDRDFRTLSLLDSRFPDVDSILQRIAGLPDHTKFDVELEEQHILRDGVAKIDLIDELISNNKTHTVGSLVRWLWAGLNIPVHSTLPSQQPLGGISDLTNKGDFDRLLISEFANDDIFFLSRLANNEALYVHREIPPAHNNLHRHIVIDSTLKSWGTPRAISFALMLAIKSHPKTDIPCSAFALGNDQYYPIATDSIENIIDALKILEGNLHPGKSLENLLKDFGTDRNTEIFLLTEKSTITQPGLLKVLNESNGKIAYVILTDPFGNIDVYKRERSGNRHVQHIKVPLEDLWTKKKESASPEQVGTKFNVDYPILLRSDRTAKAILTAPDGEVFQCTSERSVLRLFDSTNHSGRGWDLVCRDLPYKTEICEIGIDESGAYILLLFDPPDREISLLNLQTGEKHVFVFNHWKSGVKPSFIFDLGKFYHYNSHGQWSISAKGQVEPVERIDQNIFQDREKVLSTALLKYRSNYGLFKSVKKVYINESGQLVFNVHTLTLTPDGTHLKLTPTANLSSKVSAVNNTDNIFTFEDGSSVEVLRSGLLILRSSDRMVPAIYIPTVLDASLGVATSDEFAGNKYFYKEQTYRLVLNDFNGDRAELMNAMESHLKMDSERVSEYMLADLPVTLMLYCPKQEATRLQLAFANIGATVDVQLPEGQTESEMMTIPVNEFFNKHVKRYINTIVYNGTKANRKR